MAYGGAVWAPFYLNDLKVAASPLTELTFQAQLAITDRPWSFHLVNLLLHLACVWLAVPVLEHWLPPLPARIAAAVFAFHPLQTQAVVYVFARGTLLAGLFALLCIRDWQRGRLWRAAAWFGLAMLANEEVAGLPIVLALSEWAVERRQEARRPIVAMLAMALLIGARGAWFSFERFSFQGVAILRYLWLLLVPIGYTPDPAIRTGPWQASLAWGVIAAILLLALSGARARRPGFYLLAGLLLLLPSSTIAGGAELAADRRMYIPLLFLGPLLGLMLQRADVRLLLGLAAIWCGASYFQTRLWQNPQALWMEAARLSPDAILAKRQLAALLPARQAVELLDEAVRLQPDDPAIRSEIGMVYLKSGDQGLAVEAFGRALAIDPCYFEAAWNLHKLGVERATPEFCHYTAEQRRRLATSGKSQ